MTAKPYRQIPIKECFEPLLAIPEPFFLLTEPPPYKAAGADYSGQTPWKLRAGVLAALTQAQQSAFESGFKIKLFDAYRPNAVQHFMVEREYALLAREKGWDAQALTQAQRDELTPLVLRLWAIPSEDPATPPPHSTGAALDCTLCRAADDSELDMGSPIDENSPRSLPDAMAALDPAAHANRERLNALMEAAGFIRHEAEWWHFSLGDQMWAWRTGAPYARYGSAERLL